MQADAPRARSLGWLAFQSQHGGGGLSFQAPLAVSAQRLSAACMPASALTFALPGLLRAAPGACGEPSEQVSM